jgi:hypothetical protein
MVKTPTFPLFAPTVSLKRAIAWILAFLLTLMLTLSWSHAQESETQPPKDWQLKGIMAALDDPDKDVWAKALNNLATFDLKPPVKIPDERYKQITRMLNEKAAILIMEIQLVSGEMSSSSP